MPVAAPLAIGILGAARIAPSALIKPARTTEGVAVEAVAARDLTRAEAFARRHRIPSAYGGYSELLGDRAINAVYIPLPAALHGAWTVAALEAGKHVLVEKPFAANGNEAAVMVAQAQRSGLVVMEAFHSVYHPLVDDLRRLLASGIIGTPVTASATFFFPLPPGKDIRWNAALGGGALMDAGCYPLRMLQSLFGYEAEVLDAHALKVGAIDRAMSATLLFPDGPRATIETSIWSRASGLPRLTVIGTDGRLQVRMPYHPQFGASIRIRTGKGRSRLRVSRTSTYALQLEAFRDAIREGRALKSGPDQSVAMMRVIDSIYRKAGMSPREPLVRA